MDCDIMGMADTVLTETVNYVTLWLGLGMGLKLGIIMPVTLVHS